MAEIGSGLIRIDTSWVVLKTTVANKNLNIQYDESPTAYDIFAVDGSVVYLTVIFKGSVPDSSFDQVLNDAALLDFESNYKNQTTNNAIGSAAAIDGYLVTTTNPTMVAGSDGTYIRTIRTDSSGRTTIVGVGTAGSPVGGVMSIQGVSGGQAIPVSGSITATNASVGSTGATTPTSATLVGGSVTTAAPTYVNGQMSGLNLSTAGRLRVDGSGVTQTVSGTVSITANSAVNLSQVAGVATATGNGIAGTGVQRVTIASDNTAFSVNSVQNGTWAVRNQDGYGNTLSSSTSSPVGTETGLIVRNIPSGTQAVSGSVTAVLPANSGVDIGDVTINNASGASAVNIQDGGNSITVDNSGTFAVQAAQSGTWNIGNISGTISLPTGAATEATLSTLNSKTPSLGQALSSASTPVVLSSDQSAVPASQNGTWTVQPGNTANTTPWLTKISDGTSAVTVRSLAGGNALNVALTDTSGNQITSFSGSQYTEDAVSAGGEALTLMGAVRQDTISSSTSATGDYSNLKVDSVGRLYVAATIDAALPAGSNSIGVLGANSGIDIGDVTVNNASGASAVNIQDGGNSITVDNGGTFAVQAAQSGTWSARLQDGYGNTISSSTSSPTGTETGVIVRNIPSGTQAISGTITANAGTGNFNTNLAQVAGSSVATGNGAVSAGVQRVAIASDNTAFSVNAAQSGTWNITNVSGTISLPTGAATESTLSSINAKTPALGQALMASSSPVVIASNQTAIPSSQSGTWSTRTQDGYGNTLSSSTSAPVGTETGLIVRNIPSGTQTVGGTVTANAGTGNFGVNLTQVAGSSIATGNGVVGTGVQRVAIASDNTAFSVNASQSGTWNITNISGTVSLPTGAATESTLSSINTKTPSLGQGLMAASSPVVIASNQTAIPVSQSGTWTIQPGNTANTTPWLASISDGTTSAAIRSLAGGNSLNVAITDGSGNQITSFGGGTQYTEDGVSAGGESLTLMGAVRQDTIASSTSASGDYSNLKVNSVGRLYVSATIDAALPAGANSIGILGANSGVDIGDVTINNASGVSAVNIQDGGNSITVDNGGTFAVQAAQSGTWSTRLQDGYGNTVSSATSNPLGTETGIIVRNIPSGVQTVNGGINVSQVAGVTTAVNNGVAGLGTQRVVIASDNTAFTVNAAQSGTWNITNVSGAISLPTGAATETTLSSINTKTPALGQALMTASSPVVIASNQTAIPSSQSGTWNITNISGTISLPTGAATNTTLTDGTTKAVVRGGAKGSTTAADVTSTAQGANNQALDVQAYHSGSAIDPRSIRALTSSDVVSVVTSSPLDVAFGTTSSGIGTVGASPPSTVMMAGAQDHDTGLISNVESSLILGDMTGNEVGLITKSMTYAEGKSSFFPDSSSISLAPAPLFSDPTGRLETRSTILTDEFSFRDDFTGTSVYTSVTGTVTFTNGSALVSGSGTSFASQLRTGNYVKLSTDSETVLARISEVVSNTEMYLVSNYSGSTGSGTLHYSKWIVSTASGGSVTQNSSMILVNGTANGSTGYIVREVDYGPLVGKFFVTVSQRVNNQTTRIGFMSDAVANPTYGAYFELTGTTNTTVNCVSKAGASVSDTTTTTVTIPNVLTSASMLEYKIEVSSLKCSFLISDVVVAIHDLHIPEAYDILDAAVYTTNTAGVGSATTVTVEMINVLNINQIQITSDFYASAMTTKLQALSNSVGNNSTPLWISGSTIPSVSTNNFIGALHTLDALTLARVYTVSSSWTAGANTDVFNLAGSSTRTVRIRRILLTGYQTTGGFFTFSLVKRSSANSGGTSTVVTPLPLDSSFSAATVTARLYSANPTIGGTVSQINYRAFLPGTVSVAQSTLIDLNSDYPIVLRGTAESLSLNFNSTTPTGGNFSMTIWFTEE